MKRLLKILTAAVAVILLFTACQQFLEDPEDFLSYWASETFVKNHSIGSAHRPDGAGVPCVASSAPVDITLTVHNPKGFSFVMPTSSASAGIVEFKEISSQPEAGTDYELKQTGSGTLKLTYKPSLLQKYEQGSGRLNPTITLKAKDGRVFKKTYTFGIKSNTPPPKPEKIIIAKTKITGTEPKSYYVLCLKFDYNEMTRKIGATTEPVHKDVRKITINNSSYSLLYEGNNLDFKKPEGGSFIEHEKVEKLDSSSPNVPSGAWVLYYKTDIKIGAGNEQTSYTVTLRDKGGVTSDEAAATIEASGPTHTVTFSVAGGQGGNLKGEYGSNNQTASGSTEQTFNVPSGSTVTFTAQPNAGWEVDSWSSNVSVDPSDNKKATLSNVSSDATVTVKFKKKTYIVTFSVDGGTGGTLKATVDGIEIHSGYKVEHGKTVAFTATPNDGWELDSWTGLSSSSLTASLTVDGDKTVTVKFKGGELHFNSGGSGAWKRLREEAGRTEGAHTIVINGEIKATGGDDKGEIKPGRNLTIKGNSSSAVLHANSLSRIFHVQDGKTLTLENIELKKGIATGDKGGGVYVKNGTLIMKDGIIKDCEAKDGGGVYLESGTFKMSGAATVTPSTGPDQYTAGKNDVYLESGKTITVDGTLSNNHAARITPQSYTENTPVLTGNITGGSSQNRKKFIIPPQAVTVGSENGKIFWYISATGLLKAEVEDLETLKEAIDAAPADDKTFIIKLAGTIDDLQTVKIPGHKKIMLKADNASKPAILKCPKKNDNDYKHLQVQYNASLTLEGQITLQGADYGSNSQYALYVEYKGKAEIKDGVTITGFKNGNIGTVVSDGELTMSGGEISGNKAKNGGGVYIHAAFRSFTMTGGTIKGNTATENGGGVYVDGNGPLNMQGNFTMSDGTIDGNTAGKGGGVYSQGSFTMSGGTITKNKANTDGKAVMLNHYFYWQGGEIKDNRGNGSVIGGPGYYLSNNSGNTAS
ncbi:InlB B-repeat-containing protein [Treponema denticola]|uniref:InlB B-repeat-containing protein n=1 Tax=Treponema denticola TaxID=158 RepID=UPI0020A38AF6|nr:hypothetical protein [Treponema denticola]UTC84067.1 hypothetical protein HGJ18_06500 [Treponema denticola]